MLATIVLNYDSEGKSRLNTKYEVGDVGFTGGHIFMTRKTATMGGRYIETASTDMEGAQG